MINIFLFILTVFFLMFSNGRDPICWATDLTCWYGTIDIPRDLLELWKGSRLTYGLTLSYRENPCFRERRKTLIKSGQGTKYMDGTYKLFNKLRCLLRKTILKPSPVLNSINTGGNTMTPPSLFPASSVSLVP